MSTTPPITDQFQYVKLPDGSYGKFAANASDDIIKGAIQKDFPDAFKSAPDTRNSIQKTFDTNTQINPQDSLVQRGLKAATAAVGAPIIHPIKTLQNLPNSLLLPKPEDVAQQAADPNKPTLAQGVAEGVGGAAGSLLLGKAAEPIVGNLYEKSKSAFDATRSGAQAAVDASKNKLYPTSQSIVPAVSAARNLSKALIVDPAGVNNFVKAATDEAGTIVGYAKDKGIPINSKVDFANAAKQTADAVQQHFDSILQPNAKQVVAVPPSYEGPTVGEGNNATLESINNRINAISSELKSNFRKALSSQTSAANTSDADLLAEKGALTNVLHKHLAAATGLSPEDIAGLRTQAGKLRTIADEAQASSNRDLTASGKQAMGTTTSAVGTKAGLVDRALQTAQGGPEIIGNRQIKAALQKVQAQPLNLPEPIPANPDIPPTRVPISGPSIEVPTFDPTPDDAAIEAQTSRFPRAKSPLAETAMDRFIASRKRGVSQK